MPAIDLPAVTVAVALLGLSAWLKLRAQGGNGLAVRPPWAWAWIPWVGNAFDYKNGPDTWTRSVEKRLGPVFRSKVLGKPVIFCLHRKLIAEIFKNHKDFSFTPIRTDAHHRVFAVSKVAVSDAEGQRAMFAELSRVLAKKAFGPMVFHISANMASRFGALIDQMTPLERQNGKQFELMKLIPPLFYAASAQGMFGDTFPADEIFKSNTDFEDQFGLMYTGLPFPFLVSRGVAGRDRCIARVKEALAQYESGEAQPTYFMQVMFDLRHTLGWSSQDLAAYLHSYLFALTSNTIYAAYWVTVYVFSNPWLLPDIRDEVDLAQAKFSAENPNQHPNGLFEQLGTMDVDYPLLNSIINESLRLCSNGTSVREVMNDVVAEVPPSDAHPAPKPVFFKKGDIIYMPNRYHHLNPDEFEDAFRFHPRRFMDDSSAKKLRQGFFMPFGGGVSVCTGRHLALAELKALIIILIRAFDIDYAGLIDANGKTVPSSTLPLGKNEKSYPVPPYANGSGSAILHPEGDMLVKMRPRPGGTRW